MSTDSDSSFCFTCLSSDHHFVSTSSTSSGITGFKVLAYVMNFIICSVSSEGVISPRLTFIMCFAICKSSSILGMSLTRNTKPNLDNSESGRLMFSLIDSSGFHLLFFGFPAAMIDTLTSHVISMPIFLRLNFCDSMTS